MPDAQRAAEPRSRPAVTVVTRTKNRPLLLDRALRSVLQQTMTDLQMVVVNDGGDAEVVDDIVARYRHISRGRVSTIHHPVSQGMEAASNAALESSDSTYVVVHDDDDSWHPRFLEVTTGYLDSSGDMGVVTDCRIILEEIRNDTIRLLDSVAFGRYEEPASLETSRSVSSPNLTRRIAEIKQRVAHPSRLFNMLAGNRIPTIAFLYRRSALAEVGPYDPTLPVLGDWDFNIRFLLHFDVAHIARELAYYHHRYATLSAYSNTVTAPDDIHNTIRWKLLNRYMRQDMERGVLGVGYLSNMLYDQEQDRGYLQAFYDDLADAHDDLLARIAALSPDITQNAMAPIDDLRHQVHDLREHVDQLHTLLSHSLSGAELEQRLRRYIRSLPTRAIRHLVPSSGTSPLDEQ